MYIFVCIYHFSASNYLSQKAHSPDFKYLSINIQTQSFSSKHNFMFLKAPKSSSRLNLTETQINKIGKNIW